MTAIAATAAPVASASHPAAAGAEPRGRAPVAGTDPNSGTRHAGGLANGAWEAVMAAHATLIKYLASTDVWDGVSMREYDVLYTLSKCADPIAQSELERHVLLSQPAISRLVDRLVNQGLVCRSADPTDGRRVLLALTDTGRATQRRIGARHARDVTRAVTGRLDPGEIAELRRLARKLAGPAG